MRAAPQDGFTEELRSLLDEVDRVLAGQPAPTPPWAGIQQFIRASRERRRRRMTLAVALVAAAVAVVLVVQQGTFGTADDKGAPADPPVPAYLIETRGNLAGEKEWLAEFAQWAARQDLTDEGPASEPATDVTVVYASDLGGHRVAVVRGTWPSRPDEPHLKEFRGPAGAAAGEMVSSGAFESVDGNQRLIGLAGPRLLSASASDPRWDGRGGAAYVVAPEPLDVVLQQPPVIDADAKVTQRSLELPMRGGAQEIGVSEPGHYALVIAGDDGYYWDFFSEPDRVRPEAIGAVPDRGGPAEKSSQLEGLALGTWLASRQPFAQGEFRPLAVDQEPITQADPNRPLAGVLTLPSGARILAAGHISAPYGDREGGPSSRLDIARLLPAGPDAELAIAWQSYRDTSKGAGKKFVQTAALGPEGTARVEWVGPDRVSRTPATFGLASTARTDVRTVRFLDSAGGQLGTAPVLRPEAVEHVMAGSGFVLESQPAWLLPQIREGLAGY